MCYFVSWSCTPPSTTTTLHPQSSFYKKWFNTYWVTFNFRVMRQLWIKNGDWRQTAEQIGVENISLKYYMLGLKVKTYLLSIWTCGPYKSRGRGEEGLLIICWHSLHVGLYLCCCVHNKKAVERDVYLWMPTLWKQVLINYYLSLFICHFKSS